MDQNGHSLELVRSKRAASFVGAARVLCLSLDGPKTSAIELSRHARSDVAIKVSQSSVRAVAAKRSPRSRNVSTVGSCRKCRCQEGALASWRRSEAGGDSGAERQAIGWPGRLPTSGLV